MFFIGFFLKDVVNSLFPVNKSLISNDISVTKESSNTLEKENIDSENNFEVSTDESWITKTSMPTPRSGAALAVVDDKIYVIGGYSDVDQFAVNERYDPKTDTWTTLTPMPNSRSGAVAAVVDGKIYVIGGVDKNGNPLSLNERYDPKTDTWITLAPMPTPRAVAAIGVVNDKIYVIGGGGNPFNSEFTSVNEEYDPSTDKWTTRKPMPTARWRPVFSVIKDKIYVIGGWGEDGITNKNERYDPKTDTWITLAPMLTKRTAAAATVVDKKIYVIGGYLLKNNLKVAVDERMIFLQINEEYDVNLNKWVTRLPMHSVRAGVVGGVVNNKIYIIGGASDGDKPVYSALNEEYTPPLSKSE